MTLKSKFKSKNPFLRLFSLFSIIFMIFTFFNRTVVSLSIISLTGSIKNKKIIIIKDGHYVPAVKLCSWKDNKKAAYTITFDDARASHFQISAQELKQRKMVGTFYLNTKNISNWSSWKTLFYEGNEIGSHTYSHPYCTKISEEVLRYEIKKAKIDIMQNIVGNIDVSSFAYPYGSYNDSIRKIVLEYHLSARTAVNGINNFNLKEEEFGMLKAIWVTSPYDIDALNNIVLETIQRNGYVIYIFHSVSNKEEQKVDTIPLSLFKQHLDFVCNMEDSLWIATQEQVVKYIKARQKANLICKIVNNEIIKVFFAERLPIYASKVKLSFILNLPLSWLDSNIIVKNQDFNSVETIQPTRDTILCDIFPDTTLTIYAIK